MGVILCCLVFIHLPSLTHIISYYRVFHLHPKMSSDSARWEMKRKKTNTNSDLRHLILCSHKLWKPLLNVCISEMDTSIQWYCYSFPWPLTFSVQTNAKTQVETETLSLSTGVISSICHLCAPCRLHPQESAAPCLTVQQMWTYSSPQTTKPTERQQGLQNVCQ